MGFSPTRDRVPLRALGHGPDGDGVVLAAAEELGPVRTWAFNLDDDGYRVAGRDTPRDFALVNGQFAIARGRSWETPTVIFPWPLVL